MRRLLFVAAFVFVPIASWSQGNPVGPEFRVNTYTSNDQSYPSIAADSSGNFVVVWQGHYDIFGQRYASSGTPVGSEFRVNTYTTYIQWRPSVAANSSGSFVVVWQSHLQDGSSWGVFGQRFNMIVPVELMHFRVE